MFWASWMDVSFLLTSCLKVRGAVAHAARNGSRHGAELRLLMAVQSVSQCPCVRCCSFLDPNLGEEDRTKRKKKGGCAPGTAPGTGTSPCQDWWGRRGAVSGRRGQMLELVKSAWVGQGSKKELGGSCWMLTGQPANHQPATFLGSSCERQWVCVLSFAATSRGVIP